MSTEESNSTDPPLNSKTSESQNIEYNENDIATDSSDLRSKVSSFIDADDGLGDNQLIDDNKAKTNKDDDSDDFLNDYVPSTSAETAKKNESFKNDETEITESTEPVKEEEKPIDESNKLVDNIKIEPISNKSISESVIKDSNLSNEVNTIAQNTTESKIDDQVNATAINTTSNNDADEKINNEISYDNEKEEKSTDNININDMESIDSDDHNSVIHYEKPIDKEEIEPSVSKSTNSNWFSFDKPDFNEKIQEIISTSKMNLAYNRYQDKELELEQKSTNEKADVKNSRDNLKKTFNEIKTGVTVTQNNELVNGINWEFWSDVINDYSDVVKNKQDELKLNITNGIPKEIRGMVWQIICDSNSMKLKEFFINTKNIRSHFEKLIRRDLARTSFIKDSAVREKIDDLFNIIKTYSIYDEEVGYTQGMAFITVPLLMNMESDEAFCMLVRLMFTYGFREFYLPEMPGLHLRIYQFDRLIEDTLPELFSHLKNQKIKSSMYALQWFLTLFAYKFPLDMVLRIYDVVIAEGLEAILKFALNLMIKNNDHLLTLKFDELLNFLKEKLFYYYLDNSNSLLESNEKNDDETEYDKDDKNDDVNDKTNKYKIDEFIKDSMEINILPITLNKYTAEFDEINKLEKKREEQVDELQRKNGLLTKEIRKIEASYALLNKEHVEIATEMVNGKMKIGALEEDNTLLKEDIENLKNRLENLTSQKNNSKNVDFSGQLSQGLDKEIQNAMDINLKVMDENGILEDKLAQLEEENRQLNLNSGSHKLNPAKFGKMFGLKKSGKFW